jgi:hypothetical protein
MLFIGLQFMGEVLPNCFELVDVSLIVITCPGVVAISELVTLLVHLFAIMRRAGLS